MKKDFEEFFNSLNKSEMSKQWEEASKERSKRNKISTIIIIILDCFILFYCRNIFSNTRLPVQAIMSSIMMCLVPDIIIYALFSIGFAKKYLKYNEAFKEEVIDNMLKNFYEDVDYIPKKQMPKEIYKEATHESFDRYFSDDYMEAKIDNKYKIKMAEVVTEREETDRDSDGHTTTHYVTVFSGLFAKIDIGKTINGELKIGLNHSAFGKKRLEMDSQEFERYFDVEASNKITGMQLLTPDIMEILLNYRKRYREPFTILIKNNQMYIRFHIGRLFEAGLNKKEVVDKGLVKKYFDIVRFIYDLTKEMIKVVEETEI